MKARVRTDVSLDFFQRNYAGKVCTIISTQGSLCICRMHDNVVLSFQKHQLVMLQDSAQVSTPVQSSTAEVVAQQSSTKTSPQVTEETAASVDKEVSVTSTEVSSQVAEKPAASVDKEVSVGTVKKSPTKSGKSRKLISKGAV